MTYAMALPWGTGPPTAVRNPVAPRVKGPRARLTLHRRPTQRRARMKLKDRTALVTGGSRGIGRAVALALAEEGADVAVNYVASEAAAKDVAEHIGKIGRRAMLAQADVADYPDTFRMAQEVLREFGHLDILVNNAGINSDKTFVKMDHASWRKVLAINLDGVFNCTKVCVDGMLKQNYGRVVNITSVIGQIGNFCQANYAASKACAPA